MMSTRTSSAPRRQSRDWSKVGRLKQNRVGLLPERGIPSVIIHFNGIFNYKPSSSWVPPFIKIPVSTGNWWFCSGCKSLLLATQGLYKSPVLVPPIVKPPGIFLQKSRAGRQGEIFLRQVQLGSIVCTGSIVLERTFPYIVYLRHYWTVFNTHTQTLY